MALAFGLRLAWGLAAGVQPEVGIDDARWYHQSALDLARGRGYVSPFTGAPTAAWPPGYPLLLAAGYRLAGATPATVVVLNAAFGALTCAFVWSLGKRFGGRRVGLVAAALLACFPSHVFFAALALSETTFTCLVTGLVLAAIRLLDRDAGGAPGAWVAWGIGAGIAALVRAEAALLVVVPALACVSLGRGRTGLRVLVAALGGLALALAPWTLRNAHVFGTFVPTSTGFGRTLWIGHNPIATGGMSDAIQEAMAREIAAAASLPSGPAYEVAVDRLLRDRALDFARANPGRELALTLARFYHLFRGDHVWQAWYEPGTPRPFASDAARRALGRFGNAYYLVVGVLALLGWWRRPVPRDPGWRVVAALAVVWIAIFSTIYGDPRFHHLLVPPACLLAASWLAGTRVGRRWRAAAQRRDDAAAGASSVTRAATRVAMKRWPATV